MDLDGQPHGLFLEDWGGMFMKGSSKIAVLLINLLILIASCGIHQMMESYLREGVDTTYIKKVAVLKFENNSQDNYAAERLRNITMTEILSLGLFDVVDKAMVDVVLEEQMVGEKVSLDKSTLRRIAKKLGVQALVVGAVDAYEENRDGSYTYPVVALTLRLIDGASGEVIWQASGTASGYSTSGRLFGLRPKDFTQVSFDLVERLLKTLK